MKRYIILFFTIGLTIVSQAQLLQSKYISATGISNKEVTIDNITYCNLSVVGQTAVGIFQLPVRSGTIGFIDADDELSCKPQQVGIESPDENLSIELFPNPNNGSFTLTFQNTRNGTAPHIEVTDMQGRLIATSVQNHPLGFEVHLGKVSSGVYMLHLISEGRAISKRFVVE